MSLGAVFLVIELILSSMSFDVRYRLTGSPNGFDLTPHPHGQGHVGPHMQTSLSAQPQSQTHVVQSQGDGRFFFRFGRIALTLVRWRAIIITYRSR
jgi:hypothetical protein